MFMLLFIARGVVLKTIQPMTHVGITARIMELYNEKRSAIITSRITDLCNETRRIVIEFMGSIRTICIVIESLLLSSVQISSTQNV